MNGKIYSPDEMEFRRRFSVNLCKNLRFPLGEMSLYTDWVNSKRGDPYPVVGGSGKLSEAVIVEGASYRAENVSGEDAVCRRLLGQHFPYANYEFTICGLNGAMGFSFICRADGRSVYTEENVPSVDILAEGDPDNGYSLRCDVYVGGRLVRSEVTKRIDGIKTYTVFSVCARGEEFDIFVANDGGTPVPVHTFTVPELEDIRREVNFQACIAAICVDLKAGQSAELKGLSWFMDSGVAQADIRPIRYIDGTPMIENGRLFFTVSSRLVKGAYQSVISWNPTGCDFKLEGAMFFDAGDGIWCADVASSVLYDKSAEQYLIWMCSFSHDHILARGTSRADIRYGINVIDVELMPVEGYNANAAKDGTNMGGVDSKGRPTLTDDRCFMGKYGDEDPDFYYDSEKGLWFLTVCRASADKGGRYEFYRFVSDRPFDGYRFIDRTGNIEETGGSTVKVGDRRYFCCGARFDQRAVYNLYDINGEDGNFRFIGHPNFDYDDGGFRGWGTLVPVPCGNRTKYMWLTFDRHLGSPIYNWSYGNLYVFEANVHN